MTITDRMLIGAIASNPGDYEKAGQARYCFTTQTIYFSSAKSPAPEDANNNYFDLPALNADGSKKLVTAFQRYIKRWPEDRQAIIEKFALRRGWELAMELHYGGGALTDQESAEWRKIVDGRLTQLVAAARRYIEAGPGAAKEIIE
ncbi:MULTISPECIES: hypothetical protein [Herpetosiphon]|uniref:Uncharacterized protein n=1 Tax=Herpetosiphon aurantiacus (strain ATCC 23779 / DSM 785 / 114-95) TaxID=316274 RepID=A9AYX2_HERA2|nr:MULTISPECIES: hypothetical protein [Herpetosiphon]ABX07012.1 conserved hypothetical protein [Herpetosiphon aurantiacus DSM 785]MCA0355246.1 hypothetical protein [Chloroflexota bacterium]HBW52680.1 hypothetical protein [Herpetosiphon sp.]